MIVAWVDKKKSLTDSRFISLDRIKEYEYDHLLVAVNDRIFLNEIRNELKRMNLSDNRVVYLG